MPIFYVMYTVKRVVLGTYQLPVPSLLRPILSCIFNLLIISIFFISVPIEELLQVSSLVGRIKQNKKHSERIFNDKDKDFETEK